MQPAPERQRVHGTGQLSLVEHALCPLDPKRSLAENFVFHTSYPYSAPDGERRTSQVQIFCPLGLSAADEYYLWGLLTLTLIQPDQSPELFATPHWCLRQLGVINNTTKRGGRQYQQFADAIRRLSTVVYLSDAFYDPVRSEHRRVSFRFFSYSLPLDDNSPRAWRIAWDPIFFDLVKAPAGQFRFDLAVYRDLDVASRRLFLFASKVLSRRPRLRALSLPQVAVDLLGFSPTLSIRDMKSKVTKCLAQLTEMQVLEHAEVFRTSPGVYFVTMTRGAYFQFRTRQAMAVSPEQTPIYDALRTLGLDDSASLRMIRRYPARLLSEWVDITQAALERHGPSFFRKSPMAFFVDSVTKAAQGQRTAPDWWQELKRQEQREHELSQDGLSVFSRIRSELFGEDPSQQPAPTRSGLTPLSEVFKRTTPETPLL